MGRRTVDMHRLQELVRLHRQHVGAREIARLLEMSPNTERAYRLALVEKELLFGDGPLPELAELKAAVGQKKRAQEESSVEQWRTEIEQKLEAGGKPKSIYDWLKATDSTFTGSYWAVKRLCMRLKKKKGPGADKVVFHVVTAPGKEAQVDFGSVGKLLDEDGKSRNAYVFVMTLAHSRLSFHKTVFDQKAETWQQLHVDAFKFFGGVPEVIVPDNLKSAVLKAAFTSSQSVELNLGYRELARHFGFRIDPTPPYSPEKKGKVESDVNYVKKNFFKTWAPKTLKSANEQLLLWQKKVAHVRIHGTTKKRPLDLFNDVEMLLLKPLPSEAYDPILYRKLKVHRDAHVHLSGKLFSVPYKHIGKEAWVKLSSNSVCIYIDDERVATHSRKGAKINTIAGHLPPKRAEYKERDPEEWLKRAAKMGASVEQLVHDVLYRDDVIRELRMATAMVLLLENFPKERAEAACARALYFGATSPKSLRDILEKNLDSLPVDEEPAHGHLDEPAFARPVTEILH